MLITMMTITDCHYDDCPDYDGYDGYDGCGDYDGDVTAGVTYMEEYKERDAILSDVVIPRPIRTSRLPSVSLPIRDPPCRAPSQFRPLNVLRRRFGIQSPADVAPVTIRI